MLDFMRLQPRPNEVIHKVVHQNCEHCRSAIIHISVRPLRTGEVIVFHHTSRRVARLAPLVLLGHGTGLDLGAPLHFARFSHRSPSAS